MAGASSQVARTSAKGPTTAEWPHACGRAARDGPRRGLGGLVIGGAKPNAATRARVACARRGAHAGGGGFGEAAPTPPETGPPRILYPPLSLRKKARPCVAREDLPKKNPALPHPTAHTLKKVPPPIQKTLPSPKQTKTNEYTNE